MMVKNYLLVAFRSIRRHSGNSVINISGLAIGMAVCLLILHYISFERSYDSFHKNADNVYRLKMISRTGDGRTFEFATGPLALGEVVKREFPGVVDFTRVHMQQEMIVAREDTRFYEKRIFYIDPSFFKIFSFPLVRGDASSALAKPGSVLISESAARKYFGSQDPMGKILKTGDRYRGSYMVEGIFKDFPKNSHMKSDILVSNLAVVNNPYFRRNNWGIYQFHTYIQLQPGTHPESLRGKLAQIIDKYLGEEARKLNRQRECHLQPLKDIHLHSNCILEFEANGNATSLNLLFISALFIIIIAWVNYINLCTARAMERAKEVGLRKVVGSSRVQLIKQFFTESLSLNIISAVLAVIIVLLLMPFYNQMIGYSASLEIFAKPGFWLIFILIFISGVFFSGLYPAFIMSSFTPINVLKGRFLDLAGGKKARKVLVVFQFAISVALTAATLMAYQQIKYMRSQDPGFDKDQVLVVKTPLGGLGASQRNRLQTVKTEILRNPQVVNITSSFHVPVHSQGADTEIRKQGDKPEKTILTNVSWVGYNFLDTFGMKLLAGRDFSEKISTDKEAVIINEKLMKLLGYENPEKALDQFVINPDGQRYRIIGVVKDYNHFSLKEPIKSRLLRLTFYDLSGFFSFKLNTHNVSETVKFINKKWHEVFPMFPFDYFFLDEFFDRQYKADIQFGRLFGIFTLLTILIAAAGLFALSAFSAAQRTKEIGIRKVLGADVSTIITLLSKDFLKLVLISLFIGIPLTYLWADRWLSNYAYRTDIGWWFFIIPVLIIVPVVLVTISYNVIKVAYTNPVSSLRYE
jgi:putative ABC transport system permease protein